MRRACTEPSFGPSCGRDQCFADPVPAEGFRRHRHRILTETGTDAQRVELELTEGVVIADADLAEHAMVDLRALGVRMVLDDFGTGYSSLIYLRRFAFDKIKIDRSFMESMEFSGESAIIIRSIVDLGRSLGLTVTAEGVETPRNRRASCGRSAATNCRAFFSAAPCRRRKSNSGSPGSVQNNPSLEALRFIA